MGGIPPDAHHSVHAAGQAAPRVATSVAPALHHWGGSFCGFIHSAHISWGPGAGVPTWEHQLCREGTGEEAT